MMIINPYMVAPSVSPWDDEFNGVSIDPKWAWINQRTASATVAGGTLNMTAVTSGNQGAALMMDISSLAGDWAFDFKLVTPIDYSGVAVRNSANGNAISVSPSPGDTTGYIQKRNSTFGYVATNLASGSWFGDPAYIRIAVVANNLVVSTSLDGITYTQRYIIAATSSYLAARPTHIGFVALDTYDLKADWIRRSV